MPIIKSAKKRVRTSNKAALQNRKTKRSMKQAVKTFQSTLSGDKKKAAEAHSKAQSNIGKALKKNVIHKNKAARKQRQLAKAAKTAKVSVTGAKKTAKAPAKSAGQRTATKKPATKK